MQFTLCFREGNVLTFIGQYPLSESVITPYIGRPVGAILPDGEFVCGVIQCIHNGNLVLKPLGVPEAAVLSLKKKMGALPQVKGSAILQSKRNMKRMNLKSRAQIKAFGPYGYPLGWGYGSWGWGAGLWWIWPLFALTALVSLPAFFI